MANIDHEMFSLYENHNGAFFTDAAPDHGVSQATRLLSGWGVKLCDFDNDGLIDLLIASGHPDDTIAIRAPTSRLRLTPTSTLSAVESMNRTRVRSTTSCL